MSVLETCRGLFSPVENAWVDCSEKPTSHYLQGRENSLPIATPLGPSSYGQRSSRSTWKSGDAKRRRNVVGVPTISASGRLCVNNRPAETGLTSADPLVFLGSNPTTFSKHFLHHPRSEPTPSCSWLQGWRGIQPQQPLRPRCHIGPALSDC